MDHHGHMHCAVLKRDDTGGDEEVLGSGSDQDRLEVHEIAMQRVDFQSQC